MNTALILAFALAAYLFCHLTTDTPVVKKWLGTSHTLAVILFGLFTIVTPKGWGETISETSTPAKEQQRPTHIDIAGGSAFTLQLQASGNKKIHPSTVEQAMAVIRKRLNALGTSDLSITRQGDDRIMIMMSGVEEEKRAEIRTQLEKAAQLNFHLLHPESAQLVAQVEAGELVPGYELKVMERKDKKGNKEGEEKLLITKHPDLRGTFVDSASSFNSPNQGWITIIKFSSKGRQAFGDLTSKHVGERLAVVLDGVVVSAPVIRTAITQGSAEISGMGSQQAALELANALENPFEIPIKIIEEKTFPPKTKTPTDH